MTYAESKYLADPDFIATVEVYDEALDRNIPVEVGYAYKRFGYGSRKLSGIKIVLTPGIHERQLLFEATALEMVPFHRRRPTDIREPESKPQHSYRPVAAPSR